LCEEKKIKIEKKRAMVESGVGFEGESGHGSLNFNVSFEGFGLN